MVTCNNLVKPIHFKIGKEREPISTIPKPPARNCFITVFLLTYPFYPKENGKITWNTIDAISRFEVSVKVCGDIAHSF